MLTHDSNCERDLQVVRRSVSHEKLARLKTWKSFLGKVRSSVVPRPSVCPGVLCSCASRPTTRRDHLTNSLDNPPIHIRLRWAFTKQSIDKLCSTSPPFFRTQWLPNFSFHYAFCQRVQGNELLSGKCRRFRRLAEEFRSTNIDEQSHKRCNCYRWLIRSQTMWRMIKRTNSCDNCVIENVVAILWLIS